MTVYTYIPTFVWPFHQFRSLVLVLEKNKRFLLNVNDVTWLLTLFCKFTKVILRIQENICWDHVLDTFRKKNYHKISKDFPSFHRICRALSNNIIKFRQKARREMFIFSTHKHETTRIYFRFPHDSWILLNISSGLMYSSTRLEFYHSPTVQS